MPRTRPEAVEASRNEDCEQEASALRLKIAQLEEHLDGLDSSLNAVRNEEVRLSLAVNATQSELEAAQARLQEISPAD